MECRGLCPLPVPLPFPTIAGVREWRIGGEGEERKEHQQEAKRSPGSKSGLKYPLELLESSIYDSLLVVLYVGKKAGTKKRNYSENRQRTVYKLAHGIASPCHSCEKWDCR
jgi:hypothetical protein